jgi:hypothetical protein
VSTQRLRDRRDGGRHPQLRLRRQRWVAAVPLTPDATTPPPPCPKAW